MYKKNLFLIVTIFSISQFLYGQNKEIKFVAVGDIMMGTSFPSSAYLPPDNLNPFGSVLDYLKNADVLFGNHEGTLTDEGENAKNCKDPSKCYSFKTPTKLAKYLAEAGFDVMSIANNHIGDFGEIGIKNTMQTLDEHGIAYAGIFKKPYTFFEKDSITYGFCAFAPNKDTPKLSAIDKAVERVKKLKEKADIVIVSFHGGAEGRNHTHVTRKTEYFYGENRGNVYKFAHAVIDAGADVVIGHGPHVARAIEIYKNRFIAYSLGNFCTYKRFSLRGKNGYAPILNITIDENGKFLKGKIISAKQTSGVYPFIDPEKAAFKEIKSLTKTDFPETKLIFNDDGTFYLEK